MIAHPPNDMCQKSDRSCPNPWFLEFWKSQQTYFAFLLAWRISTRHISPKYWQSMNLVLVAEAPGGRLDFASMLKFVCCVARSSSRRGHTLVWCKWSPLVVASPSRGFAWSSSSWGKEALALDGIHPSFVLDNSLFFQKFLWHKL